MQEPPVKLTEQFGNIDQQIIIFTQEYNKKHRWMYVTTIIDEMRIKFYGYEDANKDAAMMHSVVSIALLFLTCIFLIQL